MKRLYISLILTAVCSLLAAQNGQDVSTHIIRQLRLYPQEKTYAHTDAADYAPGDRIWLKVYVVNALSHEPQDDSRYAYAELVGPDGTLARRVKLLCRDGIYAGYIDIPESARAGRYWLRSYTALSLGTPDYTDAVPVYVGGRKADQPAGTARTPHGRQPVAADTALQYTRKGDHLIISTQQSGESLTLLAHCRAYPFLYSPISATRPVSIHRDSIPQGVVSLLLLSKQHEVVAERLLFSDNRQEECPLTIRTDRPAYPCGSDIRLQLQAPDLRPGERADISVSVTGTLLPRRHRPSSIVAHLLLATDIPGGVSAPEAYLYDSHRTDSLLASKHWTRYSFGRMLHGDYTQSSATSETSHTIQGHVLTPFRHKPVANAAVSLIAPRAGFFATTSTGADGQFAFSGLDFSDGTNYVLRAVRDNGKEDVELRIDEKEVPDFHAPAGSPHEEAFTDIAADTLAPNISDAILLEDVEVTGTRRNSASEGNVYAQMSDFSFGLHKIEEIGATCLHELLRRIPGVRVHQDRCYIRSATSIYDDNPAAIAIDGVIMSEEYDLDIIQMQDVARVDVFKTGTTVIWGAAGGSGVISITTKNGSYGDDDTPDINQRKLSPLGYQRHTDFVQTSGFRKTLYWNPSVTTDSLTFTAANIPGTCHVVVEGVTTEGRLIHQEHDIVIVEE